MKKIDFLGYFSIKLSKKLGKDKKRASVVAEAL
jgi:hypothetical protein